MTVVGYFLPLLPRTILLSLRACALGEYLRSPLVTSERKAAALFVWTLIELPLVFALTALWLLTGRGPYRPSKEIAFKAPLPRGYLDELRERAYRTQAETAHRVEKIIRERPSDAFTVDDIRAEAAELIPATIEAALKRLEKRGLVARPAPTGRHWLGLPPLR